MIALKNMFLICAMLFFCMSLGFAQSPLSNLSEEEQIEAKENFKEMVNAIQLEKEQKSEFISISEKYGSQLMKMKESNAGKFSKYRKMKSIVKSRNQEMKKLLSSEQYKIYVEKQEEMQKKMAAKN